MKQPRSMKTIWTTTALIVGGIGAWYAFNADDETPQLPANSVTSAKAPYNNSDPTRFFSKTDETPLAAKTQGETIASPQPEQPINDCISNLFYNRSKVAKITADQKFSNLRWAVEKFGGNVTGETLDKAAKALSVDRAKLVTELRESAQALFWETPPDTTNLDKMNYWNNQKIAHEFTGISNEGLFNNAVAIAATQTSIETLRANRDAFAINAAKEIMPDLKATLEAINKDYIVSATKRRGFGVFLNDALEKLSPEKQIEFRQQIIITDHVINTLLANDKNANTSLGLSDELNDLMSDILRSGYLNLLITEQFGKDCKTAPITSLKPAP